MSIYKYKGFLGSSEYDEEDNYIYGKILHINDLVTYGGKNNEEAEEDFRKAVAAVLQQ